MKIKRLGVLVVMVLTAISFVQRPTAAEVGTTNGLAAGFGQTVYIMAGEASTAEFIPPAVDLSRAASTATINVTYTGSWTPQAQNAFEYATTIWEAQIVSSVPINIEAEFSALGTGILGGAGPNNFSRDFTGAPQNSTWYPDALANSLAGTDLDPDNPEIGAVFSDQVDWYYGTDGNPPSDQFDFVSIVLHEIGHGLGFTGSMRVSSGEGFWGSGSPYPFIYDHFTENGSGQALLTAFPNNSAALAEQLTSNDIFFDGPNTRAVNGNQPAELFAPSSWIQGSSYSHLAESFNGTPNSLMTFSVGTGVAEHDPGPVALAMFEDMGWLTEEPAVQEPQFDVTGGVLLEMNQSADNAIDLWAFASDAQSADDALTFTLVNISDADAGVTLDGNRYIDVNPTAGWTGESTVTVRVTDPDNNTAEDSFDVVVVNGLLHIYLPLIFE